MTKGFDPMDVVLWVLAGGLAVVFLGAALLKFALGPQELASRGMKFAGELSPGALKAIGTAELLGAAGLILPAVVNIAPILVPLAAVGLAVVMVGAIVVHVRRAESLMALLPAVLLIAAAVVAWGRFGPYAF